ncbi:testis-expressed protein 45 isoform X5 [Gopherus flavomarginatus]|uniref:testis-expressed protein 45 isoform X5 n=1 Tax=Gopherus flavomarginatus TaxID=286002 RepID=UPI0021CBB2D4|nr:testis-expressed protein 45 isoform X5 [Gopherus flavomarginatus]
MSLPLQGKMAATGQSLIPAPLTGIPFLKASHFQIGFDHRPQGNVVESPFRTDFPPLWGSYKPDPILLPNSKGVLNQDMDKTRETWSETHLAFPVRSLEPKPKICPPESHLQMHGDSQTKIFTSTAKESYPWPDVTLQGPASTRAYYNKEEDHFPCGDKDKLKLLPSVYRFSYPAYEILEPIARAPSVHLAPVKVMCLSKQNSSIPKGDEDLERSRELATTTTSRFFHTQIDLGERPSQPDVPPWRLQSKVPLGGKHLNACFFSTTQHSDYQPPPYSQREVSSSKSHLKSHMAFNYPTGKGAVTTTQAMLVPHRQWMVRPSEELLQQIKYSHLVPPWQGQRFFGTEHHDEFTPKYGGPVTICGGNFQVSSIPLGTLKKYCPQRQMVFAT